MKQFSPDILVSRKFLTRLRGRIFYAFPQHIAEELMWLVLLYVTGEDTGAARENVTEFTRSIFSFLVFDLTRAMERSRTARAAAARRKAAAAAASRVAASAPRHAVAAPVSAVAASFPAATFPVPAPRARPLIRLSSGGVVVRAP